MPKGTDNFFFFANWLKIKCKGKETKFVTLLETVGQMKIDQNYFGQIT